MADRALTIADMIEKRRVRWEERRDLDFDRRLIEAAVQRVLSDDGLITQVQERPYLLIPLVFYIVDKKRQTVPFFFNEVQEDFLRQLEERGTALPFYVLKGRQQGFTSLITAVQLSYAIVRKNFAGFTIANSADNTQAIFNDKARTVYSRLPEALKPHEKFNSRNEMFFDKLNSSWRCATATGEVGRSRTLNFVHFSEVAFYECSLAELQAGIGAAITDGAVVVYESTANGFNQAKELWDSGSCHNLFYAWWRTPEYRSGHYEYLKKPDAWLSQRLALLESLGLDLEQRAWYAEKYHSYLDKNTIKQEYPCTPEEAFVSSGDCVFDKEALQGRLLQLSAQPEGRRGYFVYKKVMRPVYDSMGTPMDAEWSITDMAFVESRDGYITIHEEPQLKKNARGDVVARAPYAIGGDTAGSGQDYFTAKVVCTMNERAVATLHKQSMDEDLYAEQLYCLGRYYHDALIGIEINYSRQPTRVLQKKYAYPNLYLRERLDGAGDKVLADYGFETTAKTKPIIVSELVELMRTDPAVECDVSTIKEMLTFVRKENGKTEAIDGCHDDLVMATAIAHFIGKKQPHAWVPLEVEVDRFLYEQFHLEPESGNTGYMSWEDF